MTATWSGVSEDTVGTLTTMDVRAERDDWTWMVAEDPAFYLDEAGGV